MTDPTNCPTDWVHNPSGIRIDRRTNTVIENVWKNNSTGEMIVHFSVQHSGNRHIVEVHTDPETAVSRFEQVKSLVSSGNIDGELSIVSARGGQDLTREKHKNDAIESALNYMNN